MFDVRWIGANVPRIHWHFLRRLYERYGIIMAPGQFSGMVRQVRKKKSPIIQVKEGAATREVYIGKQKVYAVFDGERPITALPPRAWFGKKAKEVRRAA